MRSYESGAALEAFAQEPQQVEVANSVTAADQQAFAASSATAAPARLAGTDSKQGQQSGDSGTKAGCALLF